MEKIARHNLIPKFVRQHDAFVIQWSEFRSSGMSPGAAEYMFDSARYMLDSTRYMLDSAEFALLLQAVFRYGKVQPELIFH